MTLGIGTHTIAAGGQDTFYFRGHPRYDAVEVTINSANTASTDVDIDIRGYDDNDPSAADSNSDYSAMDEITSSDALDGSSSDVSVGTTGMTRTMAIRVDEQGTTDSVEVTISRHNAEDEAENAQAFVDRAP